MSDTATDSSILEPWVDAKTVGKHIGFEHDHVRKLANKGIIPGKPMQNGKKVYWRFKLSQVDAFMESHQNVTVN